MKKLHLELSRKQWILLGINAALLLSCLVLMLVAKHGTSGLYSQQAAKRWVDKGESYAQVSAFFSPDRNVQADEVKGIRNSLMQKLSEDSLLEKNASGRPLIDAYSGECEAQIRKDGNTLSVTATGVGNDFFLFHPMRLLSGSYISGEDLNHDRVILDENLAWALFGSNDIVGMQIWMGDQIFVVSGVVAVEEDTLYKTAYGTGNRIYMDYDLLKAQKDTLKITCYEAVMPNPISNYAFYALKSACGQNEMEDTEALKNAEKNPLNFDSCEVIENSNRFEGMVLLGKLAGSKYQSMRTNSIGYPYWENIARFVEQQQIRLLIIRYVLIVFPIISLIVWIYTFWKRRTWTVRSLLEQLFERIREKQAKKAEEKRLLAKSSENCIEEGSMEVEEELSDELEEENEEFFQSEDWDVTSEETED